MLVNRFYSIGSFNKRTVKLWLELITSFVSSYSTHEQRTCSQLIPRYRVIQQMNGEPILVSQIFQYRVLQQIKSKPMSALIDSAVSTHSTNEQRICFAVNRSHGIASVNKRTADLCWESTDFTVFEWVNQQRTANLCVSFWVNLFTLNK